MPLNTAVIYHNKGDSADECYTPYYGVDPLLEFIPKDKIIWCPFDEEWSAFYQTFKRKGYQVVRSSLAEGQDFFSYEPEQWDIMISNPPFSKKDEVLQRAYELGKPFALLLPANSIQGKKRFQIFQNEIQMLCFDVRIDFHIPFLKSGYQRMIITSILLTDTLIQLVVKVTVMQRKS